MRCALLLLLAPGPAASVRAPIAYRQATTVEHRAIGAMRTAIFCPGMTALGSQYLQTRVFTEAMAKKAAVLVAVAPADDGAILGCADLHLEDVRALGGAAAGGESVGYVTNVCVRPEARRRGIGRGLMSLAESLCIGYGATELLLHVEPHNCAAVALYTSLGFRERERVAACQAITNHFLQMPFYDPQAPEQRLLVLHPDPNSDRRLFWRGPGEVPVGRPGEGETGRASQWHARDAPVISAFGSQGLPAGARPGSRQRMGVHE
jgi:ribosomal protein S18 acetylase RimI-like enzyme